MMFILSVDTSYIYFLETVQNGGKLVHILIIIQNLREIQVYRCKVKEYTRALSFPPEMQIEIVSAISEIFQFLERDSKRAKRYSAGPLEKSVICLKSRMSPDLHARSCIPSGGG